MTDDKPMIATVISRADDETLMNLCDDYESRKTRMGRISWVIAKLAELMGGERQ